MSARTKRAGRRRSLIWAAVIAAVLWWPAAAGQAQGSTSWSRPVDITQPSDTTWGLFGIAVCDPYQNLHVLWADNSEAGAALFYRNDVEGDWSEPIDVVVVSEPVVIGPSAAITPQDNTLHVVWRNQWAIGALYYSQAPLAAAGDPKAWSAPVMMLDSGVTDAKIMVDPAGIIHVMYAAADAEATTNGILHIRSEDGGATWSDPVTVVSQTTDLPAVMRINMAIDATGRIHAGITLRSQEYGVYSEVGYARSTDGGETWSDYRQIETMGITFQGVEKIAPYAFGENEIHLTWHDPRRLHQWSADGGETWSQAVEIMTLGSAFGGENGLAQDSAGTIHVVTAVADGVYSAAWDGREWGPPERIEDRAIDPHGQGITVCQGNQLHVLYYDRTGPERVWYSTRQVEAPHIARQPIPEPGSPPAPAATEGPGAPADHSPWSTASVEPTRAEPESGSGQIVPDTMLPLLAAGASAVLLLAVAAVIRFGHRA